MTDALQNQVPNADVPETEQNDWQYIDSVAAVPEDMLAIPYMIVVNANSPIEGASKHVGEFYVSNGIGFVPGPVTIILGPVGKRTEQITDRQTGVITDEVAYRARAALCDFSLPIVMNFRRANKSAIRNMLTSLRLGRQEFGQAAFTLNAVETKNDKGSWFIVDAQPNTAIKSAEAADLYNTIWTGAAGKPERDEAPF